MHFFENQQFFSGLHRKWVIFLWILLISSVAFGIYKNFTAINRHTVHETKVIEKQVVDTNPIENFVKNFAQVYYSWKNNQEAIDQRTEALQGYLTKALQDLNTDSIRKDIPTSSVVNNVEIWKIKRINHHEYAVAFSVDQLIMEGKTKKTVKDNVLKPIGKNYVFSELINPVFQKIGDQVHALVFVKYLDQQTRITQISQFDLALGIG